MYLSSRSNLVISKGVIHETAIAATVLLGANDHVLLGERRALTGGNSKDTMIQVCTIFAGDDSAAVALKSSLNGPHSDRHGLLVERGQQGTCT